MIIEMHRYIQGTEWTLSKVSCNGLECYGLEDEKRKIKVKGETAIPAGKYEVKFRMELSDKTLHYRKRFDFFSWHLHLQDVPNFNYIYIHVGNTPADTDGCILLGYTRSEKLGHIGNSVAAFTDFYKMISGAIENGEKVFINITEADNITFVK